MEDSIDIGLQIRIKAREINHAHHTKPHEMEYRLHFVLLVL